MSKIAEWLTKNWNGAQEVAGHLACAAPQLSGRGAPAVMSEGIALAGKKYTAMPSASHTTKIQVRGYRENFSLCPIRTGIHPTAVGIEPRTKGVARGRTDTTTLISGGQSGAVSPTND